MKLRKRMILGLIKDIKRRMVSEVHMIMIALAKRRTIIMAKTMRLLIISKANKRKTSAAQLKMIKIEEPRVDTIIKSITMKKKRQKSNSSRIKEKEILLINNKTAKLNSSIRARKKPMRLAWIHLISMSLMMCKILMTAESMIINIPNN